MGQKSPSIKKLQGFLTFLGCERFWRVSIKLITSVEFSILVLNGFLHTKQLGTLVLLDQLPTQTLQNICPHSSICGHLVLLLKVSVQIPQEVKASVSRCSIYLEAFINLNGILKKTPSARSKERAF